MAATAEGEAGIEHDIDGIWFGRLLPARTHPKALAKLRGLKIRHPRSLPGLIF